MFFGPLDRRPAGNAGTAVAHPHIEPVGAARQVQDDRGLPVADGVGHQLVGEDDGPLDELGVAVDQDVAYGLATQSGRADI